MKNSFFIAAIAMGLVLASAPAVAATKVFLLAGQSNMAGVGEYPGNGSDIPPEPAIPAPYDVPQPDVGFWHNGAWTDLRTGFGYTSATFGPEVTFGYTLNALFPDDNIYLVKYAVSSTSLAVDWNPNSGACYSTFKSRVNAAVQYLSTSGLDPVIAGMIWMQGERDTKDSSHAAAYGTNLTNFIAAVRSDFAVPDMPFVVGRITNVYQWGDYCELVRAAQATVPGLVGNASYINTDDLQVVYTGHYGTRGQVDLGIRFANEFAVPEPSSLALLVLAALSFAIIGSLTRMLRKRK